MRTILIAVFIVCSNAFSYNNLFKRSIILRSNENDHEHHSAFYEFSKILVDALPQVLVRLFIYLIHFLHTTHNK
jgi:hypothetical protein